MYPKLTEDEKLYRQKVKTALFDRVDNIQTDIDICDSMFAKNMFNIVNEAENMFSGGHIHSGELAKINNKMSSLSMKFGEKCSCKTK